MRSRVILPESLEKTEKDVENMDEPSLLEICKSNNNTLSEMMPMLQEMPSEAILWLNAVAILWGSQHPVIKMVVEDSDVSAFSLVRFALAAILASPGWLSSIQQEQEEETSSPVQTWRWGAEMGFWMFLGYAFQAIGLEYTTAQRSGFLLYLNVKFVPFFALLLYGRRISAPTWLSALAALAGTCLLAYDGTTLHFNVGDAWSIAAAAASAMFILRLERASAAVPNSAALNAACLWVVTGAALVWTHAWQEIVHTWTAHPMEILYLSGVTTALANYIQTRAQRNVTAERASIIYAMDPVYGAVWSNVLLGETLTKLGIAGATLITLAAATNAFLDLGNKTTESKNDNIDVER